jgi:hypothetical protein
VKNSPFTLSESLAMVGGIKQNSSQKNILIVECSPKARLVGSLTSEEYNKTRKKGFGDDPKIMGGEIIIVMEINAKKTPSVLPAFEPRRCGIGSFISRTKD